MSHKGHLRGGNSRLFRFKASITDPPTTVIRPPRKPAGPVQLPKQISSSAAVEGDKMAGEGIGRCRWETVGKTIKLWQNGGRQFVVVVGVNLYGFTKYWVDVQDLSVVLVLRGMLCICTMNQVPTRTADLVCSHEQIQSTPHTPSGWGRFTGFTRLLCV